MNTFRAQYPVALAVAILAMFYAILPQLGIGAGLIDKSLAEPLHLLRVFIFEVVPSNLLWVSAALVLLADKRMLCRIAPHESEVIVERTKMTIVMALLAVQYTKLSSMGALSKSAATAAILSAFGAAAIGFSVAALLTAQRYLAMRRSIMKRLPAQAPGASRPFNWRPAAAMLVLGVGTLGVLAWPRTPASAEPELPAKPLAPAPAKSVAYQQEVVERLSVGAQAKSATGRDGDTAAEGDLPDGLRFSWRQNGAGWEPAFIKRDRSGAFWWRGQRLAPTDPILKAFATEGPAVRPDASDGILFFHKDVLVALHQALTARGTAQSSPSVAIDRQADDVVLLLSAAGNTPSQRIIVSARL